MILETWHKTGPEERTEQEGGKKTNEDAQVSRAPSKGGDQCPSEKHRQLLLLFAQS